MRKSVPPQLKTINFKNKLKLPKQMQKTNDVIGLGNTLMDFLVEVDDNKLDEFDLKKSEMHLVEEERAREILKKIEEYEMKVELVPGGCAANTLRALAMLNSRVILCGKVGNDKHGENYIEQIKNHGVCSKINKHSKVTGHAITFITPDAQRTFSVHLGAAIELAKEDVLEEDIAKSKILYLEAFQLEGATREVVMHAIELAKKHNTFVSIDLNDQGVIRRNRELFEELLKNKVDIVFVNETEALELTGEVEEEKALQKLAEYCSTAIVKIGARGSLISHQGVISFIEPQLTKAIDTTGAGDTYAAGFLHGFCNKWEIEQAGKLGSLLAASVISKKGVKFDSQEIQEILKMI